MCELCILLILIYSTFLKIDDRLRYKICKIKIKQKL